MNGKKIAIIYISIILLVVIAVIVAMQVFFATYQPKETTSFMSTIFEPFPLLHDVLKGYHV